MINVDGTYYFYQGGKLVGTHKNLITDEGKKAILRYLAAKVEAWSGGIAIGVGSSTPAATDVSMNFEIGRGEVDLWSPDFADNSIIVKGTIPVDVVGDIHEVGIHMQATNSRAPADSLLITDFDDAYTEVEGHTRDTSAELRVGRAGAKVTPAASTSATVTLPYMFMDMSGYQGTDKIALAFYLADANCSDIRIKFMTDDANYFAIGIIPQTSAGYYISSITKQNFAATGTPDWANITKLEFQATAGAGGAAGVTFDGLRVNDTDYYDDFALVSRALVSPAIVKDDSHPLDIEYRVRFTFS